MEAKGSRARRFGTTGVVLALCLLCTHSSCPAFGAEVSYQGVSRPAGYVAVDFPAGSLVLAGMPLHPFSKDVDSWLGWQLTGGPGEAGAETLAVWDGTLAQYITLYRQEGGTDSSLEGNWVFETASGAEPLAVELEAGDGFWVRSRSLDDRQLYLTGEVPLEDEVVREIEPGLHVLGQPYPHSPGLAQLLAPEAIGQGDQLTFWDVASSRYELYTGAAASGGAAGQRQWRRQDGGEAGSRRLGSGEGVLLERHAQGESFTWRIPRPYAAPFARGEVLPRIERIDVDDAASESPGAHLRIQVDASRSRTLYMLYQDVPGGGDFDAYAWRVADQIRTAGSAVVDWTDDDDHSRPAVSTVAARFYLVVSGDTDSDNDGLADGLEAFIYRTSPYHADTSGNGIPNGWLVRYGIDPLDPDAAQASLSGDGIGNLSKYRRGLDPRITYRGGGVGLRVATPMER